MEKQRKGKNLTKVRKQNGQGRTPMRGTLKRQEMANKRDLTEEPRKREQPNQEKEGAKRKINREEKAKKRARRAKTKKGNKASRQGQKN